MEQCFQFAPGVPEPLGSGGYHAEMKNGFSLTLDSLKLNWNCCWCCGNIMMPPWQGGISFGQYCTAQEMASDPYLQEYNTQWMEGRNNTLFWWSCRRKMGIFFAGEISENALSPKATWASKWWAPPGLFPGMWLAVGLVRQLVMQPWISPTRAAQILSKKPQSAPIYLNHSQPPATRGAAHYPGWELPCSTPSLGHQAGHQSHKPTPLLGSLWCSLF